MNLTEKILRVGTHFVPLYGFTNRSLILAAQSCGLSNSSYRIINNPALDLA